MVADTFNRTVSHKPKTINKLDFEAIAFFLVRDSQLVATFGTTAG